jgi:hypothetical protein
MTRYLVVADGQYVTALYGSKGSGIGLTVEKDDAGTWVTYERAVEAARLVAESLGGFVTVHGVDEPDYPAAGVSRLSPSAANHFELLVWLPGRGPLRSCSRQILSRQLSFLRKLLMVDVWLRCRRLLRLNLA